VCLSRVRLRTQLLPACLLTGTMLATVLTRYRQYPCASYQLLHINASYDTFTVHVEPDRDPRPLQFAARRGRPVALTR